MPHVYILRCRDGSLYTGIAKDLARRLSEHLAGRASRYTRARRPVTLAWSCRVHSWRLALREELRIKRLPRAAKLALVGNGAAAGPPRRAEGDVSRLPLLRCEGISKAYGVQPLFEGLWLSLAEGDRVGLVGPNGCGKTTLLKVLAGIEPPDAGTRSQRRLTRLGYVPQDPTFSGERTVEAILTEALPAGQREGFEAAGRVAAVLGRAGLADSHKTVATLSAGWRKRLAIARERVAAPDVLLLDEPTNHLDVEGILWLEALLRTEVPPYLVVSHDRSFLEHVARRMLELNQCYPGGLFRAEGRYSDYLARRDEALREQAAYRNTLANRGRREVEWLRRGPEARTRKGEARLKAAGRLIQELDEVRARAAAATVGIEFTASGRQSKKLLVAKGVAKTVGGRRLLADLNLTLTPGMRLGVLGASGSGKSTLLSLLAGTLAPDAGQIERAEGLRVVRFDQEREGLDVRRPTYLEKREWEQMEETILAAEEALAACWAAVEDLAVASDAVALGQRWAALEAARAEVDRLYRRWAELEEKQR